MRTTSLVYPVLWLAAMSCTPSLVDNPLYCDDTRACDYPEYPTATFCDYDSTHHGDGEGVGRTCIEPPPGLCQRDDHCPNVEPICNVAGETCRPCTSRAECAARDPNTPHCDSNGQCIGVESCSESAECTVATAPICSAEGACAPCDLDTTGDAECAAKDAAQPWCLAGGACAACRESSHCAAAMPVCDAETHTCRLCAAHSECDAEVCHLDGASAGRCAPADEIVYVATDGVDGDACGAQSAPCRTIAEGLSRVAGDAGKTILRVRAGTYTESVLVDMAKTLSIVGEPGTIVAGEPSPPAVRIVGNSNVTLDGLTIRPAASRHGVACDSQDAAIAVLRAVVENATGTGTGVNASSCSKVTVRQSIIRNNAGGGVRVVDVDTELVNNFIVSNGTIGGVQIVESAPANTYTLRFNTVADNTAGSGVNITCIGISTAVDLANNIVHGNTGTQVSSTCSTTPPAISGCPADGNNTGVNPRFIGGGDYHIQADSPCRNKATADGVLVDIDGDPRPQGAGEADVGADEVVE